MRTSTINPQNSILKSPRRTTFDITLLSISHIFMDFYNNFLPILIPIIIVNMNISIGLSGILAMTFALAGNVLQPFLGYYMDRHNLGRLILLVLPVSAFFICMTSYATNFFILLFFIALSGIASSFFHPMTAGMVSKIADKKTMGLSISFFISGGNLGFAFAPLALVYFIHSYSLSALPLLALPALLISILFYFAKLYKVSTVNEHKDEEVQTNKPSWGSFFKNRSLLKLNAAMAIRTWGFGAITNFLPTMLITVYSYDRTTAGWFLTAFLIGAALGGLFGGYMNSYIGYKKVIYISMVLSVIPGLYFFTGSSISIFSVIALFLTGFCIQSSHPCSLIWCQRFLPSNPNLASGLMLGLSFGIGGIGAAFTAMMADYIGLQNALALTVAALLIGALIAYNTPECLQDKSIH